MAKTNLSGFTMVEAMVSVAILVAIFLLTLPALSHYRETSNSVRCMSNLRQIGMTSLVWAQENDGRLPGYGRQILGVTWSGGVATTNFSTWNWQNLLDAYVYHGTNTTKVIGRLYGVNRPPGQLFCPSVNKADHKFYNNNGLERAYGMNQGMNAGSNIIPAEPPPWTQINDYYYLGAPIYRYTRPSQTFMFGEIWNASDYFRPSFPYENPIPMNLITNNRYYYKASNPGTLGYFAFRHRQKCNVIMLDGHIEARGFDGGLNVSSYYSP